MDSKKVLSETTNDVVSKLVESQELDEIKQLTQLFNLNQMKKDAVRVTKLNDILDKLDEQVYKRVEDHPDQFSNADLLNYINTIQQTVNKSTQNVSGINQMPLIQLNQQNNVINVSEDSLSRESREKIFNAVKQFLDSTEIENNVQVEDAKVVYYSNEEESK